MQKKKEKPEPVNVSDQVAKIEASVTALVERRDLGHGRLLQVFRALQRNLEWAGDPGNQIWNVYLFEALGIVKGMRVGLHDPDVIL